jgi:hypothetical protein
MENKRYFFDRDNDGHWYMLPYDKRGEWMNFLQIPENEIQNDNEYREYMIGYDINRISFENPQEIRPEIPVDEKLKAFDKFLNEKNEK